MPGSALPTPGTEATELERVIQRFEESWRAGSRPVIEQHLPPQEPERGAALLELVHAELECRLKLGEPARVEEYLERFPELASPKLASPKLASPESILLDLIRTEHRHRLLHEPQLSVEEYQRRFPPMAAALRSSPPAMDTVASLDASARAGDGQAATVTYAKSPRAAPRDLPKVPGYDIIGLLGRGGMGVVYQARDLQLNRLVALKMVLSGEHASPEQLERFRHEGQAVARLEHLNIVQVHAVGDWNGLPFLSMEYVGGGSLAGKLAGTPQPPRLAAALLQALARGMHHAHQAGIVHRDLKPANVLLTPQGTPKITDFGLAKQLDEKLGQTQSGAVLGTPSYMAPEQAAGHGKAIGPATDVYALGAILYEMLTGRAPFRGASMMDTLEQVRNQEPVPPHQLNAKVPRDLEVICLKCLQKEPARRYASAEALADDVRRFLAGEPIHARPVGGGERLVKWVRRRPLVASLLALLALVTVTGFAVILYQLGETEAARKTAQENASSFEQASLKAQEAATKADNAANKATAAANAEKTARLNEEKHLYVAHMNLVQTAWERADIPTVIDLLKRHIPKEGESDNRGWEWYYYWRLIHSDLYTLRDLPGQVRSIAFQPTKWNLREPTKMTLAIACSDGSVFLWDAAARSKPRLLKKDAALVRCLAFAPDGKTLAWATGAIDVPGVITLWDMDAGKERKALQGHKYPVSALAWSPDGKTLATAAVPFRGAGNDDHWSGNGMNLGDRRLPGELRLWDLSGQELPGFKGKSDGILSLAFFGASHLIAGKASGEVAVGVLASRSWIPQNTGGYAKWSIAFHPENIGVAVAGAHGVDHGQTTTYRFKSLGLLSSMGIPNPLMGNRLGVLTCAFSPDGRTVATAGYDRAIRLSDWNSLQEKSALRGHADVIPALAFSADGRILASGSWDGTIKLWDMTTPQEWLELASPDMPTVNACDFSRDGKYLATGHGGKRALFEVATRKVIKRLDAANLWFSDSGQVIVNRTDSKGLTYSVLDLKADAETALFTIPTGKIRNWTSTRDLKWLATVSDEKEQGHLVKLWNLTTKEEHAQLPFNQLRSLAFSPDGKTLATLAWGSTLRTWDVQSGRPLTEPRPMPSAVSVAFSPEGKLLATSGDDHMVRLWDPTSLRELHVFKGHDNHVLGVTFSPDGQLLASGGWDRQIKIWDVTTLEERLTLRGLGTGIWELDFSPDGKSLAGVMPGKLQVWQAARDAERPAPAEPMSPTTWHRQQAEAAAAAGAAAAARFHLTPLLERDPADPGLKVLAAKVNPGATSEGKVIFQTKDFLTEKDPKDRVQAQSHRKVFTIKLLAGKHYFIDMQSSDLDPYLRLEDAAGKTLLYDDDSGGDLNARIDYIPSADTEYRIIATSYRTATGAFSLTVRQFDTRQIGRNVDSLNPEEHFRNALALFHESDWVGAVAGFRKTIELHPKHGKAYSGLSAALLKQGDRPGAVAAGRKGVELDPDFAVAHLNLGIALREQQDLAAAIVHLKRAVALDPDFVNMFTLANAHEKQGQHDLAEPLFRRCVALVREQFGAESTEYAGQLAMLGSNLLYQKQYTRAEPLLRECLKIREKQAPDAWNTFNIHTTLGAVLLGQKKYAEAEPLLRRGYEGMLKREAMIPVEARVRLIEALERLVQLYDETEKKGEAVLWRKKLDEAKQKTKPAP